MLGCFFERDGVVRPGVVYPCIGKPTSDIITVGTAKGTRKGKAMGKSHSPTSTSTPPEGTTYWCEVPEVDLNDNSVVTEEVPEVEREWSKKDATGLLHNYYA